MEFFNEKEQNLIKYMCPSCKDLYIILEKAYNDENYALTEKQVYELNHACFDFEQMQVGDIVKNINNKSITFLSDSIVEQLNEGKHCPALEMLGKMGDYFKIIIASFNNNTANEFDFEKFVELGNYWGIQYVNVNNENEKIYEYIGEDKYLYYNVYIPYIDSYEFSYKTTIIGSVAIRFYDKDKNNITSLEMVDVIKDGFYDEELKAILVEDTIVTIPHIEGTNIDSFIVGFEVEEDSYFSEIYLQKK